jgi:hypothetical protein
MGKRKVPIDVQWKIWFRAGGRCEYPGCNQALWRDELTFQEMNRAYLAHIIAQSAKGPRGDIYWSPRLAADESNLMLLCDAHHRLIDRNKGRDFPVDMLRDFKRQHEERIELLTGLDIERRTHILLFGTRIGEREGLINYRQAVEAILPLRYPSNQRGIRIDLSGVPLTQRDPNFWTVATNYIDRAFDWYLRSGIGPDGDPLNHLSIFAMAPIPLLIYLGKQLGDIIPAEVFQRQRSTSDWKWKEEGASAIEYHFQLPPTDASQSAQIALNLSLSGTIHPEEIIQTIGATVPIYTLTIAEPQRDFLRHKEDLVNLREAWYRALAEIRRRHGEGCEIHLFPAVPNAIAVELGRALLPKIDPPLHVYECDRTLHGFQHVLTV